MDATGRPRQHHLTGATIFGASSHGELKTLAIIVDAVNDTHQEPRDHTHHVWVVVDAAVDFQIVRKLARQPLHKATDSSLGTQALHLWTALRRLPKHVVLHFVKRESHRYSLGNGHIDLHAHMQLAEHMPAARTRCDRTTCTRTSNTCRQSHTRGTTSLGTGRSNLQRHGTGIPLPATRPHHGAHSRKPSRQHPYEPPPT